MKGNAVSSAHPAASVGAKVGAREGANVGASVGGNAVSSAHPAMVTKTHVSIFLVNRIPLGSVQKTSCYRFHPWFKK